MAAGTHIDGAGAIVAVRNDLVHPEKQTTVGPVTEAWILAQRFVELAVLRLCGFNGEHANRTNAPRWVGQVEQVPWGLGGCLSCDQDAAIIAAQLEVKSRRLDNAYNA